jgi:hypothetical protein
MKCKTERERLIAKGFDGLYHPDPAMECGCYADDLYPCGDRPKACRPGHAVNDVTGIYGPSKSSSTATGTGQSTGRA